MLKTIKDFDVRNKRVMVRCDFNVPIGEEWGVEDDFRIKQTIPTIRYLAENGAKIILISHLGEPGGEVIESLKMAPVQEKLTEILGLSVEGAPDCIGKKVKKQIVKMKEGEILLLENLRFYKGERENDPEFINELVKLADIYINDAFGVSHRTHASIVGLPERLPSGAGLLLEKEIKVLSMVLEKPWRPLVAIIGGVKIETKIKMIKRFLEKADHLLIGGKIANAILEGKGICVGRLGLSEEIIGEIEKLNLTSTKLHLPIDAIASPDKIGKLYIRESAPAKVRKDEMLLDIGPETINIFSEIIKTAKMIILSGPLGLFEEPQFEKGTREIAECITKIHGAYKIAGGGDTIFALSKFGLREKFDHLSTGGGAMLQFLSGEELPGLKVLEK